jgi:hypothetical protein
MMLVLDRIHPQDIPIKTIGSETYLMFASAIVNVRQVCQIREYGDAYGVRLLNDEELCLSPLRQ